VSEAPEQKARSFLLSNKLNNARYLNVFKKKRGSIRMICAWYRNLSQLSCKKKFAILKKDDAPEG